MYVEFYFDLQCNEIWKSERTFCSLEITTARSNTMQPKLINLIWNGGKKSWQRKRIIQMKMKIKYIRKVIREEWQSFNRDNRRTLWWLLNKEKRKTKKKKSGRKFYSEKRWNVLCFIALGKCIGCACIYDFIYHIYLFLMLHTKKITTIIHGSGTMYAHFLSHKMNAVTTENTGDLKQTGHIYMCVCLYIMRW